MQYMQQDSEHHRQDMQQGYSDEYNYPPNTAQGEQPGEQRGLAAMPTYAVVPPDSAGLSPGGLAEYPRKGSYGGSSSSSTAYDEKDTSGEYAKQSPTFDLPPPNPRPASGWQPGHVTRGSVALLAAAEGKIPKKEGLKMWRSDEHHGVFTAGGRGKTCFRCCCCTIVLAIIIVIGVVASFLLWVRPPNVTFEGIVAPQNGSQELTLTGSGFNLNFDLDIAVSNPNFFGASFKEISAKAYYPSNTTSAIGGGSLSNVRIPSHSHNTLFFPFALNYTKAIDPNNVIIEDIATKCGFIGNTPSNIKINYDLTLKLKIAVITISPTFSSSTSFPCPLTVADIQGLVGGSDLSGLLGGATGSK